MKALSSITESAFQNESIFHGTLPRFETLAEDRCAIRWILLAYSKRIKLPSLHKRFAFKLALPAIIAVGPAISAAATYTISGQTYVTSGSTESVTAAFNPANGGTSVSPYSGLVLLSVSGTGQAHAADFSDAFYLFVQATGPIARNPTAPDIDYYQLALDNASLAGSDIDWDAKHFITYDVNAVSEVLSRPYVPAYRSDHVYSFIVDLGIAPIGASSPGQLHFGVSDGNYGDNTGAYGIQITQLTALPAAGFTWTGTTNINWSTASSDINWNSNFAWSNNANRATPNPAVFNLAVPASIAVQSNIDVASLNFATGGWILSPGTGVLAYGASGTINITTSSGSDTINAVIADGSSFGSGGGITSVTKNGSGSLILGAANTYSGSTTLNNGILLASNSTGSATGSGNVTLNGGTLGGTGVLYGYVVASSGAHTIAPSASLTATAHSTLTIGGLTTNSNTTLAFNLVTPGTADALNITTTNGLTLGGGTIQIANVPSTPASLGYYKIIQYAGAIQGTGLASLALPATADNIAYTIDTTTNSGFITLHRGFLGDANDDGTVNFADFVQLSNHYGQTNQGWLGADFNNDAATNFADFVILSNHYGESITGQSFTATPDELAALQAFAESPAAVPEPATLSLLALSVMPLVIRRRR